REEFRGYVGSEIRFEPEFLKLIKLGSGEKGDQLDLPLDAEYYRKLGEQRKAITKKNIGRYFVTLYANLYGGDVSPQFKHTYEYYSNGHRKFHPDITRKTRHGKHDTEIKAASNSNNQNWIGVKQLENYAHNYLKSLESGLKESTTDYSFFRYGPYQKKSNVKLSSLTNSELKKEISRDPNSSRRDLLVLPANLLLFILSSSKYHKRPISRVSSNTGVNEASYWIVGPGGLSELHKGLESLDYFMRHTFLEQEARELFMLDSLNVETSITPEEVYCGRHKVKPFRVTRYFLPKDALISWNSHFRQNHKTILEEVGIKNLHHEETEVPNPKVYLDYEEWEEIISGGKSKITNAGLDLQNQEVPF
ncbi:MAG: hypothetical protein AABX03_04685, partial [Nanoarchaeota archaeon]